MNSLSEHTMRSASAPRSAASADAFSRQTWAPTCQLRCSGSRRMCTSLQLSLPHGRPVADVHEGHRREALERRELGRKRKGALQHGNRAVGAPVHAAPGAAACVIADPIGCLKEDVRHI